MDDTWDAYADGWDEQPGTRAYASAAFQSLLSILGPTGIELAGSRVVDFGCGTGLLTEQLVGAGAEVVAVDSSPAMLAVLRAKAERHRWVNVTTAADLGGAPVDCDVIVCSSVCSFLEAYPAVAAELAALLRPGGLFVQWDWERTADDDHGLTRDEIVGALRGAGLEHVEVAIAFEVGVDGQTMRPLVGHGRRPAEPPSAAST